ncbi:hypothetical protein EVB55_237 [Rhizobium phage RHph_Y68]|uniref:Uncharacterized protein n=1 Tax=Rhizobium phage RHph_Y68 TaxID=2509787 RepID=A0A7S5QYA1_9CAUD|nr:hypothetical protein PP934_gp237 [Rhizobium phage RHph_Y68]QIG68172.1 hypothetical protein EVB55_237 [Rhizobium phage RHph_Y68]
MIIEVQKLSSEESRYGSVVFDIESDHFVLNQTDCSERYESKMPSAEAFGMFEEHFQFRKPRVHCNKKLMDNVNKTFTFFRQHEDRTIRFFGWPLQIRPDGAIVRSEKSMELSFNMPHEFMKKRQVKRLHLSRIDASRQDSALFEIIFEELVTWKTRNKRFDHPVITIG